MWLLKDSMEGGWSNFLDNSSTQLLEFFGIQYQQRGGPVFDINHARQDDTIILCLPIRRPDKYRFWREPFRLLPGDKLPSIHIKFDELGKDPNVRWSNAIHKPENHYTCSVVVKLSKYGFTLVIRTRTRVKQFNWYRRTACYAGWPVGETLNWLWRSKW